MRIEYSYDLYNEYGRVEGKKINEVYYNEVIKSDFKLVREWESKLKKSVLYAKQYELGNGYILFIWKEVF